MRLAVSNIAWDVSEDQTVAQLLSRYRVDAIDIAPGKYFPEPHKANKEQIAKVRDWWKKRGIDITGMQALLFGTTGLNVFGSAEAQKSLLDHLSEICRIGMELGATRLVFGSPKNRDRSGLADSEAMDIATLFFRQLGDIAQQYGVVINLEPNPSCYGANFMTTSSETDLVVRTINHPAIRMQFDTGALTINEESAEAVLAQSASLIGHVHASEPNLVPLGDGGTNHSAAYGALQKYLPNHLVTIEMVATSDEAHPLSIERALSAAVKHYQTQ